MSSESDWSLFFPPSRLGWHLRRLAVYILECLQSILQEVNFRAQLHSGAGVRNHSSRTGISRSLLEFM